MSDAFFLQCSECDTTWDLDCGHSVCPTCSSKRLPGEPLRGVLEILLRPEQLALKGRFQDLRDTRELAPLLPIASADSFPPLAMPIAPLYPVTPPWQGHHRVFIKDDTRQPTGSFKDRASMLVVANAIERKCDTICTASTGNAGSSLAGLATAAGLRSVVLVPASAPPAKIIQAIAYGALLVPVDGTYDEAFELSLELEQRTGWINRNTAWNPFTSEGKKTAAIEICQQMKWQAPNIVFVPCGDGVIISGLYKGFRDCLQLGWIDRLPRLVAVQAAGSSVIVDALSDSSLRQRPGTHTIADSICVDAPRNLDLALRAIRDTNGDGVVVDDNEILKGVIDLACSSGVFAEPSAAAAWVGANKWLQQHPELEPQTVVLMITGSGLKAADRLASGFNIPAPVAPLVDNVMAAVHAQE